MKEYIQFPFPPNDHCFGNFLAIYVRKEEGARG